MKNTERPNFPFVAVVGQENMKKALLLNLINPSIGGVLIRGEKGTAKSTLVRALAELMPKRSINACSFGCIAGDFEHYCDDCKTADGTEQSAEARNMRIVELPINATEDRVSGSLDIEAAIHDGSKKFDVGLLGKANNNILYIDEINLLEDHIVDIILDAAAMGVNYMERDGVSYSHPARFILIGTMNPEEGDIRPQLLDRFGLVCDVTSEKAVENRIQLMQRRLEYEADPQAFIEKFADQTAQLRQRIGKARTLSEQMITEGNFGEDIITLIAKICIDLQLDGHRGDITMLKTAIALAAYDARTTIEREDVIEAARYVIPHRMRRLPMERGEIDETSLMERIGAL
ncbi:MAG: magnesium chelatase ATPase subunit I [Clostridiales bacterium]|nr:MAG: magnesium chelatase ATPase subunit I [Clostridiales bacterium]